MSKSRNPYREGSNYAKVFSLIVKAVTVTKAQVIGMFKSACKVNEKAATASAIVLLSPREDTLGNASAKGEVYFVEKLTRKEVKGVKEDQRFRIRYSTPARNKALKIEDSVPQVKTAKKVKAPAKKAVKAPAPATATA